MLWHNSLLLFGPVSRIPPWNKGLSYGIVKDIDLDLSEVDLLNHLQTDVEIVSVKRLSRRSGDEWTASESIRIGFKGSSLPSHIFILDLRIKVEPYIFPVTQCSKCWRFGHTKRLCPSNKTICPKCGGHHENCEITIFKCVNCGENHLALSKSCRIYKKEKRIRELMSEFNVTYRKALLLYVPPTPSRCEVSESPSRISTLNNSSNVEVVEVHSSSRSACPTFAEVAGSGSSHIKKVAFKKRATKMNDTKKPTGQDFTDDEALMEFSQNINTEEEVENSHPSEDTRQESEAETEDRTLSFIELIQRIRKIFMFKKFSVFSKIKKSLQVIMDWVMAFVSKSISDVSEFFKNMSLFING
ncbi:unnamed protein product [Euphydryas editha]|uniref:Gag-like protein n=1 Tax=Euphydryas editha TaxID=104508 RepID=A0AAU9VAX9_EUPED|nr:unnamed protein product [Euphydryas editha]